VGVDDVAVAVRVDVGVAVFVAVRVKVALGVARRGVADDVLVAVAVAVRVAVGVAEVEHAPSLAHSDGTAAGFQPAPQVFVNACVA
jgi:hypothetical protein